MFCIFGGCRGGVIENILLAMFKNLGLLQNLWINTILNHEVHEEVHLRQILG